jgi:hypothetical protein
MHRMPQQRQIFCFKCLSMRLLRRCFVEQCRYVQTVFSLSTTLVGHLDTCNKTNGFCTVTRSIPSASNHDRHMQAAKMGGDAKLHATLVNNLGTALRKQSKYGQALSMHKKHLQDVLATEPITSSFVTMARHSVADLLTVYHRPEECKELLDDQITKLQEHYMQTISAYKQQKATEGSTAGEAATNAGDSAEGAKDEAKQEVTSTEVSQALQALARCHLDYAKHHDTRKEHGEAILQARKASARHNESLEYEAEHNGIYVSFLAQQLKASAERAKDAGDPANVKLFKESRQLYRELLEMVESSNKGGRNVAMLHHCVADLSVEIGDTESVRPC